MPQEFSKTLQLKQEIPLYLLCSRDLEAVPVPVGFGLFWFLVVGSLGFFSCLWKPNHSDGGGVPLHSDYLEVPKLSDKAL